MSEVDELATELAEERIAHQKTIRRAEQAEALLARFRTFLDEDFRFWCSPNAGASQYATDVLGIPDQGGSNGHG